MIDQITGLDILSPVTIVMRLVFSLIAGFCIGYEREKHYQPAGLRTHMALSLGACLIMLLSIYIPVMFNGSNPNADPARLAAQVISGIGFLGAGAIFRLGFDVRGLTTAASIWTTSGIGLAFGAGFHLLGLFGTIFLIIVLQLFDVIENRMVARRYIRILTVKFHADQYEPGRVIDIIKESNIEMKQLSIKENVEDQTAEIIVNCRITDDFSIRTLFENIKALGHIITLRID
jgi:putative Mg2+ transporter-C (MgtC) family protein